MDLNPDFISSCMVAGQSSSVSDGFPSRQCRSKRLFCRVPVRSGGRGALRGEALPKWNFFVPPSSRKSKIPREYKENYFGREKFFQWISFYASFYVFISSQDLKSSHTFHFIPVAHLLVSHEAQAAPSFLVGFAQKFSLAYAGVLPLKCHAGHY